MSYQYLDPSYFRFPVHCSKCGSDDELPIADLEPHDEIECRACGEAINLTDKVWRTKLYETIDGLSHIFVIKD